MTGSPRLGTAGGAVLNLPLADGSGGAEFRAAFSDLLLPALRDFAPELVVVCRGTWARVTMDQFRHWALQAF
jgi:acetoin utilization deacetylase AcuC-like enzyme